MSPPSSASALEQAWSAHAVERERAAAITAAWLIVVLVPLWGAFDRLLEPALFERFLVLRAADAAVTVAALVGLRRARSLAAIRRWSALSALACGWTIASMLPQIHAHYELYTVGFSLVFWGVGLLYAWPPSRTAAVFLLVLAAHVGGRSANPANASTEQFAGSLFYLGSAACVALFVSSSRRRLERAAFEASFEREVQNHTLESTILTLQRTQEQLIASEKLSALGRLLAQLSHEISNPVNVLKNNLGPLSGYARGMAAVLRQAKPELSPEARRTWQEHEIDYALEDCEAALADMGAAVGRIRTVHADIRAFMRGEGPTREAANVLDGLRSTVAMFKRSLPPSIVVREQYAPLPSTSCQPGQLNQVFLNLLENARDAVRERGEIAIEARTSGENIVVLVTDTGPGVDPASRPRLFEPFFTTKDVGKGTGLGLAVCYEIMQRHGGAISLDESYPAGARFVVKLPVVAPSAGAVQG